MWILIGLKRWMPHPGHSRPGYCSPDTAALDTAALDATALAHREALAQLLLQVGSRLDSMFGERLRDAPVDAHAGAVRADSRR